MDRGRLSGLVNKLKRILGEAKVGKWVSMEEILWECKWPDTAAVCCVVATDITSQQGMESSYQRT